MFLLLTLDLHDLGCSERTWVETNCVNLRLQPPAACVEVFQFLAAVSCEDRFEAFHEFGARTMVDLDFVETEDFADLGLDRNQQARLEAAMETRTTGGGPVVPAPAPAPAPVRLSRATSGATRDMSSPSQEVSAFLRRVGCESFGESFRAYGVRTLEDLPFMEPSDLESLGLSATQQWDLTSALRAMFPAARPTPLEFGSIHSKRSGGRMGDGRPVTPTADPGSEIL